MTALPSVVYRVSYKDEYQPKVGDIVKVSEDRRIVTHAIEYRHLFKDGKDMFVISKEPCDKCFDIICCCKPENLYNLIDSVKGGEATC